MSILTRASLQTVAELLGRARAFIADPLGTNDTPGSRLALESALVRLRGSSEFHDTDYAAGFVPFGESDPVGLGVQGGRITSPPAQALPFPSYASTQGMVNWNPSFDGPPCPEGWGQPLYQGWGGHPLTPMSQAEPSGGAARAAYGYPVRYTFGSPGTYSRVPLWEHARFLSIRNNTGGTLGPSTASIRLTLTADDLAGLRLTDPVSGLPLDIRAFYFPSLVQGGTDPNWGPITLPTNGTQPTALGCAVAADGDGWALTFNVPADLTPAWSDGTWWHLLLYWGSRDPYALASAPAFNSTPPVLVAPSVTASQGAPVSYSLWARRNFFLSSVLDRVSWTAEGVNDGNRYLVADHRTHYTFSDGQFSAPSSPSRYSLPASIPAATANGTDGSMAGWAQVSPGSACGVLVVGTTSAGSGLVTVTVVVGPEITPEFFPPDWSTCPYFPPLPQDAVLLARAVLVRAPGPLYGLVEANRYGYAYDDPFSFSGSTVTSQLSVAWLEQGVPSFALPPLGDPALALRVLPRLIHSVRALRALGTTAPTLRSAYELLVAPVGVPASLAPTSLSLTSPTSTASQIFRGLLKTPLDPDLVQRPLDEPLAIQFSPPARLVLADLAGQEPSTEIVRLNADELLLTGQRLSTPAPLELFMEPSDQCFAADAGGAGTRLGRDYTLRLHLEDGDQNVLVKDWYIMASRFFLTAEEYQRQIKLNQTVGYFTQGTLASIDEWRLQGYAGLVPDLSMGAARPLLTRLVAPPDATKITEDQFIKQRQNAGESQKQIIEDILVYLEGGNEFYSEDTHQYPNLFVGVRRAMLSATTYSFDDVPYWRTSFYNTTYQYSGANPDPATLRADSFTLAQSGLACGDLERYGVQAAVAVDHSSSTGTDKALPAVAAALKIAATQDASVSEFGLRLKASAPLKNAGSLSVSLCRDNAGVPGDVVAQGGSIPFGSLSASYAELRASLSASLFSGQSYWLVIAPTAVPVGGTISLDGTGTGSGQSLHQNSDGTWAADGGRVWLRAYQPELEVLGSFNKDAQNLPPANSLRTVGAVYKPDASWAFDATPLSRPALLSLYPRAVLPQAGGWQYVRFHQDVHVCVRLLLVGGGVQDFYVTFPRAASDADAAPQPIPLGTVPAQAVLFLSVGRTMAELQNGSHGAPPGDRLVLRSS